MKGIAKILVCCAFASGLHLLAWRSFEQTAHPRDVDGRLDSLSYVPTASAGRPDRVDGKRVHDDLARLAMVARSIRTYSATGGMAAVPPMAERFGMTVSVGAWIGRDAARNAAEINGALRAAAANANVDALIIGNEALLRNDVSVAALRAMLRRSSGEARSAIMTHGVLSFDTQSRSCWIEGEDIDLTPRERSLLEVLLRRCGKVVSKEQIAESIFSFDDEASLSSI
ncbi:MAG: winged helix-turn-helix domain-containing protein, partial [Alphaproteobacteria bacterium]|nr:winged helix-turn-helix domain-containing protein [Alphaproteobacteria bacterium]